MRSIIGRLYRTAFVVGCALLYIACRQASAADTYGQWVRASQYVKVRDGTRLALDVYRPATGGVAVEKPLPVVFVATPFHRAEQLAGKAPDSLASTDPFNRLLAGLLKRGYVIAILDIRGRGASFGTVYGGLTETDRDRWDLYDIVEWLGTQAWSDGRVGMSGCSYSGLTQYLAAEVMPRHLKAIAPCGVGLDLYGGLLHANGITPTSYVKGFDDLMYTLDVTQPAARVDADPDGSLLKEAIAEHRISWDLGLAGMAAANAARPFRDSPPARPEYAYGAAADWNFLSNFKVSQIPVLHYMGWRDLMLDQALAWYRSLADIGASQQLIIGPWYHCEWYGSDLTDSLAEHLRWYDYWLKGIENGVMNGPRVRYYVAGAPKGHEWHSALRWPLPNEQPKTYFLGRARKDAQASRGDGVLIDKQRQERDDRDDYRVDYSVSTANMATRWHAPGRAPAGSHPGLVPISTSALDGKSLTYTTDWLARGAELTGVPSIILWLCSTARDQDVYVYLEEVDERGESTLLSQGAIRASDRATHDAPFDNQGLPWHAGLKVDYAEITPTVPVKIELALNPMSNYIAHGHRLRVTINNFDEGWDTPVFSPAPTVSIFHDEEHPSSITLPFIAE